MRYTLILTLLASFLASCAIPEKNYPHRLAASVSVTKKDILVAINNFSSETLVFLPPPNETANFEIYQDNIKKSYHGIIACRFFTKNEKLPRGELVILHSKETYKYSIPISDFILNFQLQKKKFVLTYHEGIVYAKTRKPVEYIYVKKMKEVELLRSASLKINP